MEASATANTNDAATLEEHYHRRGCPGIGDDSRIEWHDDTIKTQDHPRQGQTVEVTSCPDCGGRKVVIKATGEEIDSG